jgi:hypothetical protein
MSWRQAIHSIGFALISYVKLTNLHCMAFRKIIMTPIINEIEYDRISQLFNIPQDTESSNIEQKPILVDQDLFNELPFSFD